MKIMKAKYFIIIVLIILLYGVLNVVLIMGNHDDYAVLRSSSYLIWEEDQNLLEILLEDLEENKEELGPKVYGRYQGRLTFFSSYRLTL